MRSLACCACGLAALFLLARPTAAAALPRRKAPLPPALRSSAAAPRSSSSSRRRFFFIVARTGRSSGSNGDGKRGALLRSPLLSSLQRRGGASCADDDSDLQLALKATVSTAAETGGLLFVLWAAQQLSNTSEGAHRFLCQRVVRGLPVLQWCSLLLTIFGSSAVRSVLDGGLSVASSQALQPNRIPGAAAGWYAALRKPWFDPPGWLFPIMWLLVSKPTQLWGASRILKLLNSNNNNSQQQQEQQEPLAKNIWPALAVYCGHLALGDAWNQVFFGCQRVRLGAQVICSFWSMLATSAVCFGRLDPVAGRLMLPTLGWVTVASALNLEIYRLNPGK